MKSTQSSLRANHTNPLTLGLFDSGVGGMTILEKILATAEIFSRLQRIVYVADNAAMPYGNKTLTDVQDRISKVVHCLKGYGCGAVVIACHSASVAWVQMGGHQEQQLDKLSAGLQIIGIAHPTAKLIAQHNGRVAVLATDFTVNSGIYQQQLASYAWPLSFIPVSDLAMQVESGSIGELDGLGHQLKQLQQLASTRLKQKMSLNKEMEAELALVLACTHFPLAQEEICSALAPLPVKILPIEEGIVRHIAARLQLEAGPDESGLRDMACKRKRDRLDLPIEVKYTGPMPGKALLEKVDQLRAGGWMVSIQHLAA